MIGAFARDKERERKREREGERERERERPSEGMHRDFSQPSETPVSLSLVSICRL